MNYLSNKTRLFFFVLVFAVVFAVQPVFAQYWGLGYNYYGLGSSLLWPLLYLGNRSYNSSINAYPYLPYNGVYSNPNNYNFYNTYAYGRTPLPTYPQGNYSSYSPNQSVPNWNGNRNDVFSTVPPAAPDRRYGQPSGPQDNPAALNGFFQAVTTRYHNDLVKALHQPDMHSWAESVGVLSAGQALPAHLNKSRQSEISIVIRDSSLDSYTKLQLLRSLLK